MTQLISPDDPQYFEQTSYGDYDRHRYKVVGKNGESVMLKITCKHKKFGGIEKYFSHIEVLDKKEWRPKAGDLNEQRSV